MSIDLFEHGTVGRTLATSLVVDAAWYTAAVDASPDAQLRLLTDDPMLAGLVDEQLVDVLLDQADLFLADGRRGRAAALARIADRLAQSLGVGEAAGRRIRLARVLLGAGHPAEAAALVAEVPAELADTATVWNLAAGSQYDLGRYDDALNSSLRGADRAGPEERDLAWELLTNAVASHVALGDRVSALRLLLDRVEPLARALDVPHHLSKTYGDIGNAYLALGMNDRAKSAWETALQAAVTGGLEQDQGNWLGNLAVVALTTGGADEAIARSQAAVALSRRTGDVESLLLDLSNLANSYTAAQRWEEAVACRVEVVQEAERTGDAEQARELRRRLRDLYVQLGHWRKAVVVDTDEEPGIPPVVGHVPRPAAAEPPVSEEDTAFVGEVEAMVGQQQLERARAMIEEYLAEHPDSFAGYFELGLVLNEAAEYAASVAAYDQANQLWPRWPNLHRNVLNSWRALGDLETPRRRYEQQVSDNPFDAVPRMALGLLYGMQGRHDDAVREALEAVRLSPEDALVRDAACKTLAEAATAILREDWEQAWALFEQATAHYDTLAGMPGASRASALVQLGEQSVRMAEESAVLQPALTHLGLPDREAWLVGTAVAAFLEAVELEPDRRRPQAGLVWALEVANRAEDPEARVMYAMGLADRGRHEDAVIAIEGAVDDHQDNPELLYELAMLWTRSPDDPEGGLVRAEHLLSAALRLDPSQEKYAAALDYIRAVREARG